MGRSRALILVVLAAVFAVGVGNRVLTPLTTVERTMALVRQLDSIYDSLPDEEDVFTSRTDFIQAGLEVMPYMAYEGIHNNIALVPAGLEMGFQMGHGAFHLLGQADCRYGPGPVWLNARMLNPWSTWYGDARGLEVLVHEIIHIQGGPFCTGSSAFVEANTSTATVEVLAAMVNHGNAKAVRALVTELRSMGLGYLQAELKPDEYRTFFYSIEPDESVRARFEKAMRYWQSSLAGRIELQRILKSYSATPWTLVLEGLDTGFVKRIEIDVSVWPKTEFAPLKLDDLSYFLAHANDIVQALRKDLVVEQD